MYDFYCHFCNEVVVYWKPHPSQEELRDFHNEMLDCKINRRTDPKKYRCRRRKKVLIERMKELLANSTMDARRKDAKIARIKHYMKITALDDA